MKKSLRWDVIGFVLIGVVLLGIGIVYTWAPTIMPYHLVAMEVTWEEMSSGMQVMTINYMKTAAAGFMTMGLMMILIALIPLKAGERWARYGLLGALVLGVGNIGIRIYQVNSLTLASPPFVPHMVMFVVGLLCFFYSRRFIGSNVR